MYQSLENIIRIIISSFMKRGKFRSKRRADVSLDATQKHYSKQHWQRFTTFCEYEPRLTVVEVDI